MIHNFLIYSFLNLIYFQSNLHISFSNNIPFLFHVIELFNNCLQNKFDGTHGVVSITLSIPKILEVQQYLMTQLLKKILQITLNCKDKIKSDKKYKKKIYE